MPRSVRDIRPRIPRCNAFSSHVLTRPSNEVSASEMHVRASPPQSIHRCVQMIREDWGIVSQTNVRIK